MKSISLKEWAMNANRNGIIALVVEDGYKLVIDGYQMRGLPQKGKCHYFRLIGREAGQLDSTSWGYPTSIVIEEVRDIERYNELIKINEPIWGLESVGRIIHRNLIPLETNHGSAYKDYRCRDCGKEYRVHINGIYLQNQSVAKEHWSDIITCKDLSEKG